VRRRVRVLPDAFSPGGRQLPPERGPDGTPSVADFIATDLFHIQERFAAEWDDLPRMISMRSDYRSIVGPGTYVAAYVAEGQLARDGAIEIYKIDVELHGPIVEPEPD
jgi:hypothetical protein